MGRDITGVIVFAKDEKSAYKKARRVFKKLVKDEALWYFYMYNDNDGQNDVGSFLGTKGLKPAMLVDKKTRSKGYRFVQEVIRGDVASDYDVNRFMEMIEALSTIKDREKARKVLLNDRITYKSNGKTVTKRFILSDLGCISHQDKFVGGIYAQYGGKVVSYHWLESVMVKYRDCYKEDGSDIPKNIKKIQSKEYKIYVCPAVSKT